jgi:hypothetical protein
MRQNVAAIVRLNGHRSHCGLSGRRCWR